MNKTFEVLISDFKSKKIESSLLLILNEFKVYGACEM